MACGEKICVICGICETLYSCEKIISLREIIRSRSVREIALRGIFPLNCLEVMEIVRIFAAEKQKKEAIMETRKFKQVPSLNRISGHNPLIPRPVVVNCGSKKIKHERTITRPMRTNSRPIGVGEPINWDEVYD
jgi:hypothetical protein